MYLHHLPIDILGRGIFGKRGMAKGFITTPMGTYMMGSGRITKSMALVNTHVIMAKCEYVDWSTDFSSGICAGHFLANF